MIEVPEGILRVTYGVQRSKGEHDNLPLSFVRYVLIAVQEAVKLHEEGIIKTPQVSLVGQDWGRLAMAKEFDTTSGERRLDIRYLEDVLEGKIADPQADTLLNIASDREAAIRAAMDMLGISSTVIVEIDSVIKMLVRDKRMREFYLKYLATVVDNLGTNVFHGMAEGPLRAYSLGVLPNRLRSPNDGATRWEDRIYPHTQGGYATWAVHRGDVYLAPPGYERVPEFGNLYTIELLRKLTAEVIRRLLAQAKIPLLEGADYAELAGRLEDPKRGWRIEEEMMGSAYYNEPSRGKAKRVDPYYDFGDDVSFGKQVMVSPTPRNGRGFSADIAPTADGRIGNSSQREVLDKEVNFVLRKWWAYIKTTPTFPTICAALRARIGTPERFEKFIEWAEPDSRQEAQLLPLGDLTLLADIYCGFADQFGEQHLPNDISPKSIKEIIKRMKGGKGQEHPSDSPEATIPIAIPAAVLPDTSGDDDTKK